MKIVKTTVWVELEEGESDQVLDELVEDFNEFQAEGDILGYRIELEGRTIVDESGQLV